MEGKTLKTATIKRPFEDEIRKAKEVGYSDEEINNYISQKSPPPSPVDPPKKVGGLRGTLANFLPTVLGAVGTVGGGIAGSVVPGAGTTVGAVGGGTIMSGVGEWLRQKINGEDTNVGSIAREGALGAVPGVFKGVKAIKGAVTGGKAVDTGLDAAKVADKPNIIQKAGQKMTVSGSGFKVGPGVGDVNKLDEQAQFMAQKGFTGTPEKQLRLMSDEMNNLSKQVDDVLTSKPIQISGSKVSQNIFKASTDPNVFPELDITAPRVGKIMQSHSVKVQNITNAKELNDYVKTINKAATQARAKMADPTKGALNANETAALATKRIIDDQLTRIPDIAPLKKDMAMIFESNPSVAKASEKGFGVPFVNGVKLKTPAQLLAGAQSKAGALLQGGQGQPKTGGFRPFVRPALEQGATRVASSALLGTPLVGQGQEESALPLSPQATIPEEVPPQETAPSRSQQLFEASMQLLQSGDIEGAKALSAFAQQAAEFDKANSPTDKKLTASQATRAAAANNALRDIPLINEAITSGKLGGAKAIPGSGTQVGRRLLGTENLDAALFNIADNILRARSGAAAPEAEVKRFVETYLPSSLDSEQAKREKLARAVRELQGYVNPMEASADTLDELVAVQ